MLYMSHIPDKTDPGEAVPLLEVDGWRGVARLNPHHGGLHLGRRPEVVLPHLEPDSVIVKSQSTTSQPSDADPDSDPANSAQRGPDALTYKSDPVKKKSGFAIQKLGQNSASKISDPGDGVNWLASVMQRGYLILIIPVIFSYRRTICHDR